MMRFLSVCSGIEAASVAWHPLGWEAVGYSETEKFPSAVLAHHYPNVPNCGDMTRYAEWPDLQPDLIVGGTPCQSFSVAGLRAGLADPRGNLALVFLGLVDRFRPRWVVWENVPGVRSSGGGRDFGAFLGALGELGYGWAYRSLDAQYFGLAQRRQRVFVVGYLGDWRPPAAVLLERESVRGNPAPSREARQGTAPGFECGPQGGRDAGDDRALTPYVPDIATCLGVSAASASSPNVASGQGTVVGTLTTRLANNAMGAPEVDGGHYIPWPQEVAPTLNAHFGDKQGLEDQHALNGAGLFVPHVLSSGQAGASLSANLAPALDCLHEAPIGLIPAITHTLPAKYSVTEDGTGRGTPLVALSSLQVRRLTPRECERLQGFPDDYTLITHRGKPAADGPRYKALGNSMAVPVMHWIGERIALVESEAAVRAEYEAQQP